MGMIRVGVLFKRGLVRDLGVGVSHLPLFLGPIGVYSGWVWVYSECCCRSKEGLLECDKVAILKVDCGGGGSISRLDFKSRNLRRLPCLGQQ
jgi:hypothetical protein